MMFGAGDETMLRFLANAIRTIAAAALLVLAIALAPTVEKAFATSRLTINQATLNRLGSEIPVAAKLRSDMH